MKKAQYKTVLAATIAVALVATAVAGDNTASPALGILSTVTAAELPIKASDLVAQADIKKLKETTIDVVKAAVGLNPAAAPAIVGCIAQASPAMAATASATAVALVPNQALAIARAAAAACPAKAGAIVEAICRVLPADFAVVAEAVAEVVPGAGKEILAGISAAIPQLKNAIDQTLGNYQGSIPSISTALNQVMLTQGSPATAAVSGALGASPSTPPSLPRGPGTGAPFVPITGTPGTITPGSGGVVPPGPGYVAP
jgi:hypothetical protein